MTICLNIASSYWCSLYFELIQAAAQRAQRRALGLHTLKSLLTCVSECASGVKCALLLYLPPAMRGLLQRLAALGPDAIALRIERSLMAATAVSSTAMHNHAAYVIRASSTVNLQTVEVLTTRSLYTVDVCETIVGDLSCGS
jgi:hypothetical protein